MVTEPMKIELHNIAKRYRYEWIFRDVNYTFRAGQRYAVLGPNGSGKSTLLNILSGHLTPSHGKVLFSHENKALEIDEVYRHIAYAAPYIELIEELTLIEAIRFHQHFKPFLQQLKPASIIDLLGLESSIDKEIKFFSSGMKQRLKLVLAICSDTSVLFLDEPTTNLDQQGFDWYRQLIDRFIENRLVIVASNVKTDYSFCEHELSILDFKKKTTIER